MIRKKIKKRKKFKYRKEIEIFFSAYALEALLPFSNPDNSDIDQIIINSINIGKSAYRKFQAKK